jgi:hypothetical protein
MSVLVLTITMTFISTPTMAYKYTGSVKTLDTSGWQHWQEVLLEEGDDSVGGHCNRFVQVLDNAAFTAADCLTVSESLSGVGSGEHHTLPVGKSMWVPYIPHDLLIKLKMAPSNLPAVANVPAEGFRTDLSALRVAFERAQEKQLTEAAVKELLEANNAILEARLKQVIQDEVKAGLTNVASADAVSDLSKQVKELGGRPMVTVTTNWFWWLVLLTALVLVLFGLVWYLKGRSDRIEKEHKTQSDKHIENEEALNNHAAKHDRSEQVLKDHGKRLDEVEETLRYVVTYNTQKRFNCPNLTDAKLNDLPIGKTIGLQIEELGIGAVFPKVDIEKGENDAGDQYLVLVGTKNAKANQIDPKTIQGKKKFVVAQVFKQLAKAIEAGEIIGVTEGRKQL